jgi:hypothetical protein
MVSLGSYGWITVGLYGQTILFVPRDATMRVKTSFAQSGIISLALDDVTIHKGATWNTGLFFKADHFMYGFSFVTAYSWSGERTDKICAQHGNGLYSASDPIHRGWNMHTLNFNLDYDFTKEHSIVGPRLGFFYNYQIAGTRVFKTTMAGASLGLDIVWSF